MKKNVKILEVRPPLGSGDRGVERSESVFRFTLIYTCMIAYAYILDLKWSHLLLCQWTGVCIIC